MATAVRKVTDADRIRDELQTIQDRDKDGLLRPEEVVKFASDSRTALHNKFEWSDTAAAREYRLWQAREVISVFITVLPHPEARGPVRAWVSLVSDRVEKGGGYRSVESVLTDNQKRAQLLAQALKEFQRVEQQYRLLKELDPIFRAIAAVTRRAESKRRKPRPK
jgi:hypothetical protein